MHPDVEVTDSGGLGRVAADAGVWSVTLRDGDGHSRKGGDGSASGIASGNGSGSDSHRKGSSDVSKVVPAPVPDATAVTVCEVDSDVVSVGSPAAPTGSSTDGHPEAVVTLLTVADPQVARAGLGVGDVGTASGAAGGGWTRSDRQDPTTSGDSLER